MDCSNLVKADIARRTHVPTARIHDDTELGSLAIESFALVEFLIDLQERHGIRLVVEDLRDLRTVRDLTLLVQRHLDANAPRQRSRAAQLCA